MSERSEKLLIGPNQTRFRFTGIFTLQKELLPGNLLLRKVLAWTICELKGKTPSLTSGKVTTNVPGGVTSFAGRVNFFCPSWISCIGAWFERFWDILWHHFHPERVVSFKERAERGWKSGARSLSWKSGWKPCTLATTRSWIYPKTFFRFRERSNWKFP